MHSMFKLVAIACPLCAMTLFPAPVQGEDCGQLWYARNSIFADAGHCFQTPRAIAAFGSRCYPPYGRLTANQQARVNAIIDAERRQGCTGESAAQEPQPPAQAPVQPAPSPTAEADKRLSEAASVWAATKDTSSPAILQAFITRFGDTAFGDIARARLDEVKKAAPPAAVDKAKGAVEPAETDLCPKYIPGVGKIVQAPCEH